MLNNLAGTYTTIITPFDENNKICEKTLKKIIDFQISNGIRKICPNGVTGETAALTDEEKIKIAEICFKYSEGRAIVIPDMGTENLSRTKLLFEEAKRIGIKTVLAFTPYLDPPTKLGMEKYFLELADNCNIPFMIHNLPGRTTVDISIDSVIKLAKHPNIVGMKEGNKNIIRFGELIEATRKLDFVVLSGNDFTALPAMLLGADGHISVAANIIPRQISTIVDSALNGDFVTARDIYAKYHPLFRAMYLSTNPIAVKEIISRCHFECGKPRLPLTELDSDKKFQLDTLCKRAELW